MGKANHPQKYLLDKGLFSLEKVETEDGWEYIVKPSHMFEKELRKISRVSETKLKEDLKNIRENSTVGNTSKKQLKNLMAPKFENGKYIYPEIPFENWDYFGIHEASFIPPHMIGAYNKAHEHILEKIGQAHILRNWALAGIGVETGITGVLWYSYKKFPWPMFVPLSATAFLAEYFNSVRNGRLINRVNQETHFILTMEPERFHFNRKF